MVEETKAVSLKVPARLLEKIDRRAKGEFRTRSNFILVCIQRALEKKDEKNVSGNT